MIIYRVTKGRIPTLHIASTFSDGLAFNLMVSGEEALQDLKVNCEKALEETKAATDGHR